jgi:hypothetical protein
MNVLKNFEALFVVTLGLACAANYALDNNAEQTAAAVASHTAPAARTQNMQVVVVSAKRLSPAQKKQSLANERNGERKAAVVADNASASTI